MDKLTLTYREAYTAMGISEATFRRLKAKGVFDRLMAPLPRRLSAAKVKDFVENRQTSSRPWRAA
jgi:hypothetical protein